MLAALSRALHNASSVSSSLVRPDGGQQHHGLGLVLAPQLIGESGQLPGELLGFLMTILTSQRPAQLRDDLRADGG